MQRTNSEYGSPYLATHHFPFLFLFLYDDRTLVIRITKYEFICVMLTELRTGGA